MVHIKTKICPACSNLLHGWRDNKVRSGLGVGRLRRSRLRLKRNEEFTAVSTEHELALINQQGLKKINSV